MARIPKMLVADDSRTIQLFFRQAIAKSAHPVELISAENGQDCAALLDRGDFDLAFIDVNMPGMSGMEAVGAARHKGNKTFVTLMSTNGSAPRRALAKQLNVYDYLVKPFTASDIETIVAAYRRIAEPMRTLIVDDSRAVRSVIRRVMEGSIFRLAIEEADDSLVALERCRETPFDMVFLDCNMPDIDGLATLERLLRRKRDAKVIMISSERDEGRVAKALERGALAFLHKPFYPADVDRALHQAFGFRMPGLADAPAIVPQAASQASAAIFLEDVLR